MATPQAPSAPAFKSYGTDKKCAELQTILRQPSFVHILAGAPGSMKTTVLSRAAEAEGLRIVTNEINHQSLERILTLLRQLGDHTLDDDAQTLWHFVGAELQGGGVWKNPAAKGKRIILEMCDVPIGIRQASLPTLYFNRVPNATMRNYIRDISPQTPLDIVDTIVSGSDGDLHQAQTRLHMGCHGNVDREAHTWFDTQKLLTPGFAGKLPPENVSQTWVSHNITPRCKNIEGAAQFAETNTIVDMLGPTVDDPMLQGLRGCILQSAVITTPLNVVNGLSAPPRQVAQGKCTKPWEKVGIDPCTYSTKRKGTPPPSPKAKRVKHSAAPEPLPAPPAPQSPRGETPINFEGAAPLWANDLTEALTGGKACRFHKSLDMKIIVTLRRH